MTRPEAETRGAPGLSMGILSTLVALIGALCGLAGGYLATLGGSIYYLVAGVTLIAVAVLLWRGDRRGVTVYWILLAATLAWSVWEVGTDPWGLVARLSAPTVLGLYLLAPWVTRRLGRPVVRATGWLLHPRLALGLALSFGAALVAIAICDVPGAAPRNALLLPELASTQAAGAREWTHYGATLAGTRFSPAGQINRSNVSGLEQAWVYRTGGTRMGGHGALETTPIMVGDSLYLCTPDDVVISLNPETGQERWRFNPGIDQKGLYPVRTCRGVAFYRAPAGTAECPERVLVATLDARLIAVDALTGRRCPGFGVGGVVDLRSGMGGYPTGIYAVTSAPTVVRGNVIVGGGALDGLGLGEPSGVVRAFDALTGRFAWAWDMGRPGEYGEPPPGATYTLGTPTSWAPMSGDEQLGLVYLPTNASLTFWGGDRTAEAEKFSGSVIALDASTGTVRWSFQTVHHDLWDYDVASQPTLLDLVISGRSVPALIQPTKRGQIFVLDRRDGTPLFPVTEPEAPRGGVAGDRLAATQPRSPALPDFGGRRLTESAMWGLTPIDQLYCRIWFRQLDYRGPETPLSTKESLIYPGSSGGINWGGVAVDPERHLMIVNALYLPYVGRLLPQAAAVPLLKAQAAGAHSKAYILPQTGAPFAASAGGFLSPLGVPCNEPPFGTVSGVDLGTGKLLWTEPLGTARDSGPLGIPVGLPFPMGVPNMGGAVVTRGGVVFIGATQERAIRALDISSGRELWYSRLPAGGQATPMTYISPSSGRQFVVIAAGGNFQLNSRMGDYVVAYALARSATSAPH